MLGGIQTGTMQNGWDLMELWASQNGIFIYEICQFVVLIALSKSTIYVWFQYGFCLAYLLFSPNFRFWQRILFVMLEFAICQKYLSNIPNLDINGVNLYTIWKSIFQTTTLHFKLNINIQSMWSYKQNNWHALLFSATVLIQVHWEA
jgi:hypothetical protein